MHKRDDIRMLCSSILFCSKFNRCCVYVGTHDTLIMADSEVYTQGAHVSSGS